MSRFLDATIITRHGFVTMMKHTTTFVWLDDRLNATCHTHAPGILSDLLRIAEKNNDSVVFTATNSWYRVNTRDARDELDAECPGCVAGE